MKSAVALVFDAGIDPRECELASDFLLNEGGEPCFGYFYARGKDPVTNRPVKLPFHCVHVVGSSSDSTLLGYVEFYGLWRMVLCLSETYSGPDFSRTYAIDPIKGEELDISVNLDFSVSEIREAYEYERYDDELFLESICDVFDTAREIGFNREMERVIKNAVSVAVLKSGAKEGDILTDEQAWQLPKDIVEGMMPFITHNLARPSSPQDDAHD